MNSQKLLMDTLCYILKEMTDNTKKMRNQICKEDSGEMTITIPSHVSSRSVMKVHRPTAIFEQND